MLLPLAIGVFLDATPLPAPAPSVTPQPAPVVPAAGAHPSDPLAAEYLPLPARGMGASPGQVRFLALGGFGLYRDAHLALQGTTELLATPNFGLRGSLEASTPLALTDAQLFAARVGPSLHLLPYRAADLGVYLEAGGASVDLFRARRSGMFTLVPGATFDIAVGTNWLMRFEGQVQMGTVDRNGAAELVLVPALLFGLGPVL